MKTWRVLLAVGTIPVLLGVAVVAGARQPAAFKRVTLRDGTSMVRVAQPTHWVAFQAVQILNLPDGEARSMRYRASNGSLATYSIENKAATIHNVAARRTFVRNSKGDDWVSYPLDANFPPSLIPEYGVKGDRFKLLTEKVQGLPVVELIGNSGTRTVVVPSLNNLPLRAFDPAGKLVSEHRNIKLDTPAADLFVPPAGAQLKVEGKPLGQQTVRAKAQTK